MTTAERIFRVDELSVPVAEIDVGVIRGAPKTLWISDVGDRPFSVRSNWSYSFRPVLRSALVAEGLSAIAKSATVTLHAGGPIPDGGLGIVFARHLYEVRKASGARPSACITVLDGNTASDSEDLVRVPHLLAIRENGETTDRVIWELMTPEDSTAWLGGVLPDMREVECQIGSLLWLRRAVREGTLPSSPSVTLLIELLRERYLSTLFILQHYGAVVKVLQELKLTTDQTPESPT